MGWLRTVTVGRERDKVKPNGKKRSNLPVTPHPQPSDPDVRISRARSRRATPARTAGEAGQQAGMPAEPASERRAAALFSRRATRRDGGAPRSEEGKAARIAALRSPASTVAPANVVAPDVL